MTGVIQPEPGTPQRSPYDTWKEMVERPQENLPKQIERMTLLKLDSLAPEWRWRKYEGHRVTCFLGKHKDCAALEAHMFWMGSWRVATNYIGGYQVHHFEVWPGRGPLKSPTDGLLEVSEAEKLDVEELT